MDRSAKCCVICYVHRGVAAKMLHFIILLHDITCSSHIFFFSFLFFFLFFTYYLWKKYYFFLNITLFPFSLGCIIIPFCRPPSECRPGLIAPLPPLGTPLNLIANYVDKQKLGTLVGQFRDSETKWSISIIITIHFENVHFFHVMVRRLPHITPIHITLFLAHCHTRIICILLKLSPRLWCNWRYKDLVTKMPRLKYVEMSFFIKLLWNYRFICLDIAEESKMWR